MIDQLTACKDQNEPKNPRMIEQNVEQLRLWKIIRRKKCEVSCPESKYMKEDLSPKYFARRGSTQLFPVLRTYFKQIDRLENVWTWILGSIQVLMHL